MNASALTRGVCVCLFLLSAAAGQGPAWWTRHTIDNASKGADGVRLADMDGDGRLDIITPWEEGGVIRVAFCPVAADRKKPWPAITVGKVASPEDALAVDLDGDGRLEIVSLCEGENRTVYVHWPPQKEKRTTSVRNAEPWTTEPVPATKSAACWMFAAPIESRGGAGSDLVLGAKNPGGQVAWLVGPLADRRDLAQWRLQELAPAAWIMAIDALTIGGLHDSWDVLYSDRRPNNSGVFWLDSPVTSTAGQGAKRYLVGDAGREVMFGAWVKLGPTLRREFAVAVRMQEIHWFEIPADARQPWRKNVIDVGALAARTDGIGLAKAVADGDFDNDGLADLVLSCEHAHPPKRGVVWLRQGREGGDAREVSWELHDVSGPEGVKFDLLAPHDVDEDGDLDIITCEEVTGLGVVWYENPAASGGCGPTPPPAASPR